MLDLLSSSARLVQTCIDLAQYLQKIENLDSTIAVFSKEISDLSVVLSKIGDSIRDIGSSVIALRTGQRHWEDVALSINDCQETLRNLERLVMPPKRLLLTGFLRRARDQILLDWNSHDIQLLQRQIVSCRQTMELSLQMITVTTLASNENQLTNVASKLEEMDSKIDQLLKSLRSEPSHYPPVTSSSNDLDLKHRRVMGQLQHCVLNAKSFVSNASSSLSSGSSIFEYDHMSDSKRKAVEDWARLASPEDPPEDLVLGKKTSPVVEIEEIRFEDTPDLRLDFQVIQNWRQAATKSFKAEQYSEAEALLRQVWENSNEKYDTDYYWRDGTMEMLVKACMEQEKWDEAEELLVQTLDEQTRKEKTTESTWTRHKLAGVYLAKGDLENAQHHCQQAFNVRKRELGETDFSVRDSIQLLVQIFEANNDEISAAGYRPLLRPENWNRERNALQELSWMRAGEASVSIGVDYFEDLLPEEVDWKWDKIRKNIRRRSTGICGSGYGYTLLHALVEFGQEDTVRCMIEIERRNRLVDIDPFVDVKDNEGNTPLQLAAEGRLEITRLLIENGAHVNETTTDGRTPLIIATKSRSVEIVQLLIDHGADVMAQDELEWTALHHAVFVGAGEVAELLIESGADVGIKGASDRTPLHCAAVREREDIVRLLLEKGANVKVKSSDDKTPLDLAERKNERVARILRSYTQTRRLKRVSQKVWGQGDQNRLGNWD